MRANSSGQTRRRFLKRATVGGTAVALTGLSGCSGGGGTGGQSGSGGTAGNTDAGSADESSSTDAESESPTVFMLLPNQTTIRFERRDAPLFMKAMNELMPEAEVVTQNAQGDPQRQQRQVEDALAQGADAIVFVAADANLAAGSLKAADDAGVPMILYEHDANDGPADAHVLFDALAVGQAQGKRAETLIDQMLEEQDVVKMSRVKGNQGEFGTIQYEKGQDEFIQPYIDRGEVEVVTEQFTPNWDPTKAQQFAEDTLTRVGGDLDMFLCMNDGTAGGSVAALISQGYEKGDVVVTGGQDATVEAMQFILEGWQDNTIFKDLRKLATAAAEVTVALLEGDDLPENVVNAELDNGYEKIPAGLIPVQNVTEGNAEIVVEADVWTWEEVCKGGAKDHQKCQTNL
jgi:D-xylose transport system substrate-binding protein